LGIIVIIGVFFFVILIINTFITGNTIEKNCLDLRAALEKYYNKEAKVLEAEAKELKKEKEVIKNEKETLKAV